MWKLLAALLALAIALPAAAAEPASRRWVELTGRGAQLRAVVPGDACPEASLDGRAERMHRREGPSAAFPVTTCQLLIPPGVRRAAIGDWTAPLPAAEPQRILIFGDTGCRLKGQLVQACNDMRQWPFALVAARAAEKKPDLVIHVGDYWYRESPCPAGVAGCAGSPSGDNWNAWDADFFQPAAPLLDQAPWVFARGNHEACSRGGPGWFRLLDQAPQPARCPSPSAPFRVKMGDTSLYVVDSADANDTAAPPDLVKAFARQLDAFGAELNQGKGWLVTHRPVWGLTPVARLGPLGPIDVGLNKTEQAAVHGRAMAGVQMIVSGHIHHFATYDFGGGRPAQLIAGTGGDVGEPADSPKIQAGQVSIEDMDAEGFAFERYGYLLLERHGADWSGDFRDLDDKVVASCRLHGRSLTCRRADGKS